jgi:hypothetical protein
LLERVHATELIVKNVADHVEPFVKKHKLLLSNVLCDYCKEVMDSSNMTSLVNNWENRILVIMDLVHDSNFQSIVLLEAMRRTSIPWSKELEEKIHFVTKVDLDFARFQLVFGRRHKRAVHSDETQADGTEVWN